MSRIEAITKELKGRVNMEEEIEKELFEKIAIIEESDGAVEPMKKADWALALFFIIAFGFVPVIWNAFLLF